MICAYQILKADKPADITVEYPFPCGKCELCLQPKPVYKLPKVYTNPLECDRCHTIHHLEVECPDIQF